MCQCFIILCIDTSTPASPIVEEEAIARKMEVNEDAPTLLREIVFQYTLVEGLVGFQQIDRRPVE